MVFLPFLPLPALCVLQFGLFFLSVFHNLVLLLLFTQIHLTQYTSVLPIGK